MSAQPRSFMLRCPQCAWENLCGVADMARWLVRAGKLRARGNPDAAVLVELFRAGAAGFACPACAHTGLAATPAVDEEGWPGPVPCQACGRPITPERLEALPGVRLCAACQLAEERGAAPSDVEYCPRCGAPMELRPTSGAGLTRYRLVCTGSPPCRS